LISSFQNVLSGQDTKQLVQAMTSNKVVITETGKAISSKAKVSTVTDDVNTESYQTSGTNLF
jgi:soluble cytochrome b562